MWMEVIKIMKLYMLEMSYDCTYCSEHFSSLLVHSCICRHKFVGHFEILTFTVDPQWLSTSLLLTLVHLYVLWLSIVLQLLVSASYDNTIKMYKEDDDDW